MRKAQCRIKELETEDDILKQAAVYFAKNSRQNISSFMTIAENMLFMMYAALSTYHEVDIIIG